jgi:hypothetical protein
MAISSPLSIWPLCRPNDDPEQTMNLAFSNPLMNSRSALTEQLIRPRNSDHLAVFVKKYK